MSPRPSKEQRKFIRAARGYHAEGQLRYLRIFHAGDVAQSPNAELAHDM